MFAPTRPDRALRSLVALRRWGPTPAAAYTGAAARYPDRLAIVDERGTLTFEEVHRRTNALARELARGRHPRRRRRRDHVPQPPRLHRGDRRLLEARRQRPVPEHRLRRARRSPTCSRASSRRRRSTTRSSPTWSPRAPRGASASSPGASPGAGAAPDPRLEELIGARQRRPTRAAGGAGQGRDPHLGHDRHAEGRGAQAARLARARRGAVLEDPAARARRRR